LFDWNGVKLRQIGIVASPSEENLAQCILHEGEESHDRDPRPDR